MSDVARDYGFAGLPERYQPTNLPRCAACGSQIVDQHVCPSPSTTSYIIAGGWMHLTPWGTWEWRPW